MKNFRVIGQIDPRPLLARIKPEMWQAGPRERYEGSVHGQASSIMVRWVPAPEGVEEVLGCTESVDYPAAANLMPEVGEAVMQVLEPLGAIGDLGHVMLTRLPPGGQIASHIDEGVYADLYDRFHVCLAGGGANTFRCGGEVFSPKPGEIFWFNHKREHSVHNVGSHTWPAAERIHLIVDVMAPNFTQLRGVCYQAERITDLWPELEPLLEVHWREVAHYQDIALDPDKDAYAVLQEAGQLRCFTARDAGRLVGYVFFFVRPNIHYRASRQANQDVLFLHPDYRRGRTGITLIRVAETRLRAEGVQVVYHHAKRTNRVGELLERLGYDFVEGIYAKRLDGR